MCQNQRPSGSGPSGLSAGGVTAGLHAPFADRRGAAARACSLARRAFCDATGRQHGDRRGEDGGDDEERQGDVTARQGHASLLSALADDGGRAYHCRRAASQARAAFQSRFTVIGDTCSTSATSSSRRPPKKRSSTTRAARGSAAASATSWRRGRAALRGDVAAIQPSTSESGTRLVAAALVGDARPRVVDQDPAHRLGGDREEMRPILVRHRGPAEEAKVELVDDGIGLERVVAALAAQQPGGELAQLRVHDGEELVARLLVAGAPAASRAVICGRRRTRCQGGPRGMILTRCVRR